METRPVFHDTEGDINEPIVDFSSQALMISDGSFIPFVTRPISGVTLSLAVIVLTISVFSLSSRRGKHVGVD